MTALPRILIAAAVFCCLLFAVTVSAQQQKPHVHLITLLWNDDESTKDIYPQCQEDVANVQDLFEQWDSKTLYEVKTSQGKNTLLNKINRIELRGNDDILFFYYSGHGAVDAQRGHYFQCKGNILRSEVLNALQAKKAKLTVLLSDSCAVGQSAALTQCEEVREQPLHIQNMRTLFRSAGLADINSSSKGEYSWCDDRGGLFTLAFVNVLKTKTLNGWGDFVRHTRDETQRRYSELRKKEPKLTGTQEKQTVWEIDLPRPNSDNPAPDPPLPPPPGVGVQVVAVVHGTTATQLKDDITGQIMTLEKGDVIDNINGMPISTLADYDNAIDSAPRNSEITIFVRSNEKRVLLCGQLDRSNRTRFGARVYGKKQ